MGNLIKIKGYEHYYISDEGYVISTAKHGSRKLKVDRSGRYSRVSLCSGGKVKRVMIHILVARNYIPNPENKPFVNHLDGKTYHNYKSNLEWCTRSENQLHAYNTGLQGRGELMAGAVKSNEQVAEVCDLIEKGWKRGDILLICPFISKASFDDVRSRKRWTHISESYSW